MRAHTEFRSGEWSEARLISHGAIIHDGQCVDEPTVMTLAVIDESTESSPAHVPVLVAIGATLAIVALVSLVIVVAVCSKIRRRKRKLQRVLKRQVRLMNGILCYGFMHGKVLHLWDFSFFSSEVTRLI